jgi:hypothetical protein
VVTAGAEVTTALALALVVGGQRAVGIGTLTASHALGYVHPATSVAARLVSDESNHPFPMMTELGGLGVKVGGGNVGMALVDV